MAEEKRPLIFRIISQILKPLDLAVFAVVKVLHFLWKQTFSIFLGDRCRYFPCCSDYAVHAFEKHGAFKGLYLTVRRLLRCHPWSKGGFDFVP